MSLNFTKVNDIKKYLKENLTEKRYNHTMGVLEVAKHLANLYGEDVDKAELAALYHDMCRNLEREKANDYIRELGLDKELIDNPNLAHGKLAAEMIQIIFNESDNDIINAVRFHTTGRANMSKLEKIIYVADSIEVGRDYLGVEELRTLANRDLNKSCYISIINSINFIKEKNESLHKDTLYAKAFLEKEMKNGK